MRVIAGEKRHLILKTLDSLEIRPTTDKIKETLFNIIQWDIPGSQFLDLFAGSGAIGIEALSRGAASCTFIDNNIKAIKVIEDNISHTGLNSKSNVIKGDSADEIIRLGDSNKKYNIIFIDPPYEDISAYKRTLKSILDAKIYTIDTKIILEANKDFDIDICKVLGYDIIKEKIYKSNKHVFMKVR